jgi:hypothetical protein
MDFPVGDDDCGCEKIVDGKFTVRKKGVSYFEP